MTTINKNTKEAKENIDVPVSVSEQKLKSRCEKQSLFDIAMFLYSNLGIEQREGQKEMIKRLCDTIDAHIMRRGTVAWRQETEKEGRSPIDVGLGQVPTGTGKSMAIILTALSAWLKYGMKSVVSTHTHVLQDQMLYKDFPFIKNGLMNILDPDMLSKWQGVILKGLENHICRKRINLLKTAADSAKGKVLLVNSLLERSVSNVGASKITVVMSNRLKEITTSMKENSFSMPEDDPLFHLVKGDRTMCNSKECRFAGKCPYMVSVRMSVPFIITNHAYLTSCMRCAEESVEISENNCENAGELGENETVFKKPPLSPFRSADIYFFDEAHHLAGYRALGKIIQSINIRDIEKLLNFALPGNHVDIFQEEKRIRETFRKEAIHILHSNANCSLETLNNILGVWRTLIEKTKGATAKCLWSAFGQASEILMNIVAFKAEEKKNQGVDGIRKVISSDSIQIIMDQSSSMTDDLKIAFPNAGTVFGLSGTLFNNDSEIDSFVAETGLTPTAKPFTVDSPFKYDRVLIWVPESAPIGKKSSFSKQHKENEQENFAIEFCKTYIPGYLHADMGGVLILSSSKARMNKLADETKAEMERLYNTPWLIMKQGEKPRRQIAKDFTRSSMSCALFASASFREGFDARGKQLTWVIIDRLPFPVPGSEDMIQIEKLKQWGFIKDEFAHMVATMKIHLTQSIGRLIRTEKDWGAVTLLDNRILYAGSKWKCETCFPVSQDKWYTGLPLSVDEWIRMVYNMESGSTANTPIIKVSSGNIERINRLAI